MRPWSKAGGKQQPCLWMCHPLGRANVTHLVPPLLSHVAFGGEGAQPAVPPFVPPAHPESVQSLRLLNPRQASASRELLMDLPG